MEEKMTLEVSNPMKVKRARDKIAEEIAEKNLHKFFVREKSRVIMKGRKRTDIRFEVINPMKNLMKDLRRLLRLTKVKMIEPYTERITELVKVIASMSVTPDLAFIFDYIRWGIGGLVVKSRRCEIGLVEVKRGKSKLSSDQKEDIKRAKENQIAYYLLRIDDSDFINGKFELTFEPRTPKANDLLSYIRTTIKE